MIGKNIKGYIIVGSYKDKVVIAYNSKACEPWVVWHVDQDGDTYGGTYSTSREFALKEFSDRVLCHHV